jgi:hypothetical protein
MVGLDLPGNFAQHTAPFKYDVSWFSIVDRALDHCSGPSYIVQKGVEYNRNTKPEYNYTGLFE